MYNGWNECEKALTFLEKADKIDPNYNGLQTEEYELEQLREKYKDKEFSDSVSLLHFPWSINDKDGNRLFNKQRFLCCIAIIFIA